MNCQEFLIEFEERGSLSETAFFHLTICADCKKLSERQTQVWLMIDGLNQVAAPNDFDFRVKARIANAKPSDFHKPVFLPVLRYVLPLSVVVLLLGLFVFNSAYFSDNSTTPQIAQSIVETPRVEAVLPVNIALTNQLAFVEPENEKSAVAPLSLNNNPSNKRDTAKPPKERIRTPKTSIDTDEGGGSHEFASSGANTLTPIGINLTKTTIADAQILQFFGIETAMENGRRTVKSLMKDSAAERSGVKVGDVVEKIKNNSLTILRGTEKLEITLQNNVNEPR